MACRSCGNKSRGKAMTAPSKPRKTYSVMGNYKYLKQNQINKRLEVFKRIYCKDCPDRYVCDITMYNKCTKVDKGD